MKACLTDVSTTGKQFNRSKYACMLVFPISLFILEAIEVLDLHYKYLHIKWLLQDKSLPCLNVMYMYTLT